MWTQLNNLTVQKMECATTNTGKEYLRILAREPFNAKGYTPTYTLMVYDEECIENCKSKLSESIRFDCLCKIRPFLNRTNEVQDLSFALIDFVLSSYSEEQVTKQDKYLTLSCMKVTSVETLKQSNGNPYISIKGYGTKETCNPQYCIQCFDADVIKKVEKFKLSDKSYIHATVVLSPFLRKRNDKSYQDYAYKLKDFEFVENKVKDTEKAPQISYNADAKEWKLDDLDIFSSDFLEKI